jgi:hypothetical protein
MTTISFSGGMPPQNKILEHGRHFSDEEQLPSWFYLDT